MAKPEWGAKRLCQSCGAKFYDMVRNPIVCPKCSAPFDVDSAVKLKRGRSAPQEPKPKEKPTLEEVDAKTSDDAPALDSDETDDEAVLENTDDLEEDAAVVPVAVTKDDDERTV